MKYLCLKINSIINFVAGKSFAQLKYKKPIMLRVKVLTFNPVQENTYILYNEERQCCIVDPGCYFENEKEELAKFIMEEHLQPTLLLNTHCHLDHVFGNKYVSEKWGLRLHFHEKEKPVFDFALQSGEMWQMPFENYNGPIIYIKENTTVNVGKDELEIRFTPGHSPGSISFYHKEGSFVIGGDVLFYGSIGRTDLPGSDAQTLVRSIQTQLFTLPNDTIVYSGHGPTTTIEFEKANNPFVKL